MLMVLAKAEILHILFRIWVMVLESRVMTINKASWNIIHPSVSFWLSYVSLGQCSSLWVFLESPMALFSPTLPY